MKKSPHHAVGLVPLRPRPMLFTLLGDYVYPRGGHVWLGSLVAIGRALGLSEVAVRSAVARMARERWIVARRLGNRSFYRLSPAGHTLLEEGTRRIYHADGRSWDGAWCLLSYSVPESKRALRDRMRKQLAWLGFGQLASGTYVAPRDVSDQVRHLTRRLGTGAYAKTFMAHGAGGTHDLQIVDQCWDLTAIAQAYDRFRSHYAALFARDRALHARHRLADEDAFIMRLALTHDFRRFPFIDPDLPRVLLPKNWAGARARALFETYHDLLTGGALRYFSACAAAGSSGYS